LTSVSAIGTLIAMSAGTRALHCERQTKI